MHLPSITGVPFPGDSYTTPPGSATAWGKRLPSLTFFFKILEIIRSEGVMASSGTYAGAEWGRASMRVLRALEESGCSVNVEGLENVSRTESPCVFIGNHMSTLETFVLPIFIQPRREVTFVVKESLMNTPFFKYVLMSRNPIVVGRSNPRQDLTAVLEGGEERLKNGTSIIIFPQSTRSTQLVADQFNSIGVKLARRAKVPVVPVALRTDAWAQGIAPLKDFGPIHPDIPVTVNFGEPFMVEGNGKAEHARVYEFIASHLTTWGLPPVEKLPES